MKNFYQKYIGIRGVILTAYLWLVLGSSVFVVMCEKKDGILFLSLLITLIPSALLSIVLINLFKRIHINPIGKLKNRSHSLLWLWGFALLGFGILMIYYKGYYPGGFTEDSVNQYTQAMTGKYNNWHPVLQTLFMFTLPLKLTGGWTGSVILFQMICFSLCAAYMCYTMLEYGNRPVAIAAFVFTYLNPVTGILMVHAWKDPSFAIAAMLCMTFAVRTYFTNGEWLKKWYNIVFTVIAFTACTLFRHNGIFFTLPLLLAIVTTTKKRTWITVCASVLAMCFIISLPVYSLMGVENPKSRTSESAAFPVAVIGEIAARHPEKMDPELREFAYKVASPEVWQERYVTGKYNSIKFSLPTANKEAMDEYGIFKIGGLMFKALGAEPKAAIKAMIKSTDLTYNITDDLDWTIYPYIARNDYNIKYEGDNKLKTFLSDYNEFFRTSPMRGIFWMLGTINLLVVAAICAKLRRGKHMWSKLLIAGSMLIYNFCTMMLLAGGDFRFFYYSYSVLPLILLVLFRKDDADDNNPSLPVHTEGKHKSKIRA